MKPLVRSISAKGILLSATFAIGCVAIGYFCSLTLYSTPISEFAFIKEGVIPGTNYSFIIGQDSWYLQTFIVQNRVSNKQIDLLAYPDEGLKYALIRRYGATFLIVKHPPKLSIQVPQAAYFVWNITGDEPYFLDSVMSCIDPKLIRSQLEFPSNLNCASAGEYSPGVAIIELR